jgi:hypothetical protein
MSAISAAAASRPERCGPDGLRHELGSPTCPCRARRRAGPSRPPACARGRTAPRGSRPRRTGRGPRGRRRRHGRRRAPRPANRWPATRAHPHPASTSRRGRWSARRRRQISTPAWGESSRGIPSAYPTGRTLRWVARSVTEVPAYPTGVPAPTAVVWTIGAVRRDAPCSSTVPEGSMPTSPAPTRTRARPPTPPRHRPGWLPPPRRRSRRGAAR